MGLCHAQFITFACSVTREICVETLIAYSSFLQ